MIVQDCRVLIMGMGRSGQSAARLALQQGAKKVVCVDANPNAPVVPDTIAVYGPHRKADFIGGPGGAWEFERPDFLVLSPGISPQIPELEAAATAGIPILGELDFAQRCIPSNLPVVAVTGTNGKSSTAWFTHQLFEHAGLKSALAGNIGRPLSELAMDIASGRTLDVAVVEVSSYQLESLGQFHAQIGAILNLTPDHLVRHGTMERYGAAKMRLFENMGPDTTAILVPDIPQLPPDRITLRTNAPTLRWIGRQPGLELSQNAIVLSGTPDDGEISLETFQLPGAHNRLNIGVACLMAVTAGVARRALNLRAISPLKHRLEPVHREGETQWINDSKATNIESTLAAIEGVPGPLILLIGGQGKAGADYTRLRPGLAASAAAIICFGASANEIAEQLDGLPIHISSTMTDAVHRAHALKSPGTTVLLSPACASFDEFPNFEVRGDVFRQLAKGESQ